MLILKLFIFAVVIVQSSTTAYAEAPKESHSFAATVQQANYFVSLINGVVRAVNADGIHRINVHGQYAQFSHKELLPENVVVFQPLDHQNDIVLSSDLKLFVTHQQQLAPLPVTRSTQSSNHIVILHTAMGVFMADTQNRIMLKVSSGQSANEPDWITANSGKVVFAFSLMLLVLAILVQQLKRHRQAKLYANTSSYLPVLPVAQNVATPNKPVPPQSVKPIVLIQGPVPTRSNLPQARLIPVYNACHLKVMAELITPVAIVSKPDSHAAIVKMMPRALVVCRVTEKHNDTMISNTADSARLLSEECEARLDEQIASGFVLSDSFRAIFLQDILNARVKSAEQADFFVRFIAVLQQNYEDEACSVSEVADALATSPRNLSRKLKEVFEAGFTDLLKQYRLYRSCDFLLQGERITQVAVSVGFGTASYYAKCFKKYAGTTPRKFQLKFDFSTNDTAHDS